MSKRRLDDVDEQILKFLSRDARISNRKIAAELGITEGTVRSRIKRMQDEKLIRITAVTNIEKLKNPCLAFIWVDVDYSSDVDQIAAQLSEIPAMGFVAKMLGRFDILAITLVQDTEQLTDFLHSNISTIKGIRRTETSLGVNFVKHDYRVSRIVG
ncbi:Lrp/AsnC family transcriptional regulator for asnA, asnC and gidA [Sinobacterium caligoides]|uniref:Lrp/AsnC family transcriptional regulator for asnA, asnC and gidA n=1 Tax=Sinobacterium caligoides TaxID=933926 RepID=A0A3N2E1S3_9GAMM|nr:Lrp/AsnC family transcriptional regulator [Sinobacterium caligoides]ROS05619.1 Lrp/AsnC family transcriptional regulator for asnA, asnC and gidA [Sinobacterium caligoides]